MNFCAKTFIGWGILVVMDDLLGFPIDLKSVGLDDLPKGCEEKVIAFFEKVNKYDDRVWASKSQVQAHSGCSSDKVKKILNRLLLKQVIEYAQHGSRVYYKLKL